MAEILARLVPTTLASTETQAFILAGLCFIGSWVLISKVIQFVFSMIWPFLLVGAFLTLAPQWTNSVITQTIPEYLQMLQNNFKKVVDFSFRKRNK